MTVVTKQIHNYTAAITIDGAADYLLIDPSSTGTYNKINRNVMLGITSTPIGAADAQSLSNKTLDNTNSITVKDGSFTIQNSSDTTKRAVFSAAGITTSTTRTLTLPNRSDTLVTLAGTETLTNKTVTSPTITGGSIDNSTITVDSISGHTSAGTVTVGGVQMVSGVVSTASSVTATAIAPSGVQPQALQTGTGTGWSWSSWTPTFTNLTVGNGTLNGKYIQIGKTVFYRLSFILGSSSSVGTGVSFTLPVTSVSYAGTSTVPFIGSGQIYDNGVALYVVNIAWASTTTGSIYLMGAGGTYVTGQQNLTASVPMSWGLNDEFGIQGYYEAA